MRSKLLDPKTDNHYNSVVINQTNEEESMYHIFDNYNDYFGATISTPVGTAHTEQGALAVVRKDKLRKMIRLNGNPDVPQVVKDIAKDNINWITQAQITIGRGGVVYIDGNESELAEWYTITHIE